MKPIFFAWFLNYIGLPVYRRRNERIEKFIERGIKIQGENNDVKICRYLLLFLLKLN